MEMCFASSLAKKFRCTLVHIFLRASHSLCINVPVLVEDSSTTSMPCPRLLRQIREMWRFPFPPPPRVLPDAQTPGATGTPPTASSLKLCRCAHLQLRVRLRTRPSVANKVGQHRQWTHLAVKQKSMARRIRWKTEASAWPATCVQTGLSCVVKAAVGDDSRLIYMFKPCVGEGCVQLYGVE